MKYFGGKNRLGKHITKIINNFIDENTTYVEPFVGGFGLGLTLKKPGKVIINDNHYYLIEMWKKLVETDWTPFIEWENTYQDKNEESYKRYLNDARQLYPELKKFKNGNNTSKYSDAFIGYFGFCVCYSAKWFGGLATRKTFKQLDFFDGYKLMQKQVDFLKSVNVTITNLDYKEVLKDRVGCVIYLDPPYLKTTGYTTGEMNYTEFWNIVRNLSKNNWVFISEEQAPDDFIDIMNHTFTRGMKNKDNKQIIANEKLFIHKDKFINYNNTMNKKEGM